MVQSEQSGSHNLLPLGKENTIIAFHGKNQLVEQTFSLPSETLPASRPRQAEIVKVELAPDPEAAEPAIVCITVNGWTPLFGNVKL